MEFSHKLLVCSALLVFVLCGFTTAYYNANHSQLTGSWSQTTGLMYLYYSYAAYCPAAQLSAWNCKWCQQNVTQGFKPSFQVLNNSDDVFAYGGYDPSTQTILIAFRGTQSNNLRSWIDDLENMELVPWKGNFSLMVGDGWYRSYFSVSQQIYPQIAALVKKFPKAPIVITGHSLGAALAGVCATDLSELGYQGIFVYDYGEPRIGNQNFSNYIRQFVNPYYRTVNGKDIVPKLPYEWMGYYHQPQEVWENPAESMTFKVCSPTDGEDPTCSDSVDSDSIYDHLHYYGLYESC